MSLYNTSCLLAGAGGTGKTHTILNDKGFVPILYVGPNWELLNKKKEEYPDIHIATFCKVTGEVVFDKETKEKKITTTLKDKQTREFGHPLSSPVIFVDELTMLDPDYIPKVKELYPYSLIFYAGDIDNEGVYYQCSFTGDRWTPPKDLPIHYFTTDYRSKTEELKNFKLKLRKLIEDEFPSRYISEAVEASFPTITTEEAILQFNPSQDIFLAGLNNYLAQLPFTKDKQKFSVHKAQGKTIRNPSKIFIATQTMFEETMLYTAVSRAEHHNQLIFVKD
jgi:hypothetical protein